MSAPNQAPPQGSQYCIQAAAAPPVERTRVLKQDNTFGIFDQYGDIGSEGRVEEGIFHRGVRHLSELRLRILGARPLLLSSTVRQDNVLLAVDLMNPDILSGEGVILPHSSLHIYRAQFLWNAALHICLSVKNFTSTPIQIGFALDYDADFRDIFEVRGEVRPKRGTIQAPHISHGGKHATLAYEGLDGIIRRTVLETSEHVDISRLHGADFSMDLKPGQEKSAEFRFLFDPERELSGAFGYSANLHLATTSVASRSRVPALLNTSNEQFDSWLERSRSDLNMLLTVGGDGIYPYAGVPWFSTPFGRDGIITALECLWIAPHIARGVLRYLTDTQARQVSPDQDAEPGKILHEARDGEMAALGEIPFAKYYGSVDSTPLYLLLAGAFYRRTADLSFMETIWPGIELALQWLDQYGDVDGDGFIEYHRLSEKGLVQQGWKDSQDSVFHASDGRIAEGPIALCEVQAYAFAAKLGIARVASALGRHEMSRRLRAEARILQERFEAAFWSEQIGTYAIALDGAKQQCRVRTSNAGHCLFGGIASPVRAAAVAGQLNSGEFYSGWGIRTVAEGETRYNPMSYHNGSVWPHDNAVIAAGFARYRLTHLASGILSGMFESSAKFDLQRLPELFCGFARRAGKAPTLYPVACSPQAWSAGAAFLLLKSTMGLSIDAVHGRIILTRPVLPPFLEQVRIRDLSVGTASVDLTLFRSGETVAVTVARRVGDVEILVLN